MSELEDLRRSEARFRALTETSAEVIFLTAGDGTILYRSPSAARLLGWTEEEMRARSWGENILANDRARVATEISEMIRSGARQSALAFRAVHRDGTILWMEGSATNLLDDPNVGAIVAHVRDVTPRMKADQALQRSEARYRQLIEELPEPILVHVDRRIAYANAAAAAGLGVATPADLIGRSVLDFASAATRAAIEARMASTAMSAEGLQLSEQAFVRPSDGEETHAEVKTIPIVYEGQPAMLSIARDITLRVNAERAAHAAERDRESLIAKLEYERHRLGALLAKAPAFIAALRGKDHVFELANDTYRALAGGRPLIGRSVREALPEAAEDGLVELLDRVLETGEPFQARGRPVKMVVDGNVVPERRFIDVVYQPLVEADGTRSGVFIYGMDVTAATVAQRRLRAQFHGVPLPTYVWQREERGGIAHFILVDFNEAALTGSRAEAVPQRGEPVETYSRNHPSLREDLERCLASGENIQRETSRTSKRTGETRRVSVTYAPAPPDLVIVHAEDITERVKQEDQARQAQKMEAIGRLAGGVAHDFNNLLSIILSYADLNIEQLEPGEPLRHDLEEIQAAGRRAAALTRQLLAFSRQQVLQPRVIDVGRIVGGMSSMLGRLLGEDIVLRVTGHCNGRVLADPGQVEQVVMNLALNARDAMPDGGTLAVEVADVLLDEGSSEVPSASPGAYVLLAIRDTGSGMSARTQARIFEPFFTTKELGKGTGLGLATVFGIVKQSGGYVGVDSESGHGTTFRIYLPRTEREAEAPRSADSVAVQNGGETILLVEDEDQVRVVARTILRRHGYSVLEAANGDDALRTAQAYEGSIALLLTDVVMPRMSGRKLAEQLALVRPEMKLLFVSGYTDDAMVHHGVLEAGVAFLQKPLTPEALLRKVREVLDSSS